MVFQVVPEISNRELACLYNLGGYCLKSIKKTSRLSDRCWDDCVILSLEAFLQPELPSAFVFYKDFTGSALVYPSPKVYQMIVIVEKSLCSLE